MYRQTEDGRRARASVRRFASASEADRHDLEYWRAIPDHEHVLEVWRLSLEQWRRVVRALEAFGTPTADITQADFERPGVTCQIEVVLNWTARLCSKARQLARHTLEVVGNTAVVSSRIDSTPHSLRA